MAFISGEKRPSLSEVVYNFSPAWFTVCMGTGAMQQMLFAFPFPETQSPQWMRNLGFCFWVLDIALFLLFSFILTVRYISYPELVLKTITDFPRCSYIGAIPIALDTIIEGMISYYGHYDAGKWAVFAMFWMAVAITVAVSFGLLLYQMIGSSRHSIEDVAGIWLMTVVPLVIVAAVGSNMSVLYSDTVNVLVMIVSFLLWACGLVLVHIVLVCFFWRLVSCGQPPEQLLPSSFLPLAPLSQAASAGLQLSIAFSEYLQSSAFVPTQSAPSSLSSYVFTATAQSIHWAGILIALSLLAQATFWLVQATAAMCVRRPKHFAIGMWSLTFPYASYTTAWALLAKDLSNRGMAGFAAANMVLASIVWLFCAGMTILTALFTGQLFKPGQEKVMVGTEAHLENGSIVKDRDVEKNEELATIARGQ